MSSIVSCESGTPFLNTTVGDIAATYITITGATVNLILTITGTTNTVKVKANVSGGSIYDSNTVTAGSAMSIILALSQSSRGSGGTNSITFTSYNSSDQAGTSPVTKTITFNKTTSSILGNCYYYNLDFILVGGGGGGGDNWRQNFTSYADNYYGGGGGSGAYAAASDYKIYSDSRTIANSISLINNYYGDYGRFAGGNDGSPGGESRLTVGNLDIICYGGTQGKYGRNGGAGGYGGSVNVISQSTGSSFSASSTGYNGGGQNGANESDTFGGGSLYGGYGAGGNGANTGGSYDGTYGFVSTSFYYFTIA
jgi:hypothetical protein